MKKLLLSTLALSALMFTACSNEDLLTSGSDGPVVFTVSLPGEFTRSISDGLTATQLSYAVYPKGENTVLFTSKVASDPQAPAFDGLKTTLSLDLAKGKEYDIIFWADKPGNGFYTFSQTEKTVTINYDGIASNDEDRDAFFAAETIKVTGAATVPVTLRRPFAQLNFATSDLKAAEKAGFIFGGSRVKVSNVYTTLNLLSGKATDGKEVTFAFAPKVVDENAQKVVAGENGTSKTYDWLSMNYLLTGYSPASDNEQMADSELVDLVFTAGSDAATDVNTINVSQVPVQRNYRTNIYGNLLTSTVDFAINIEPNYYEDDYTAEYDGEGFRVSHSLAEAQNLLKAGEPAVSVDAAFLSATRAATEVEFLLNKTLPWQKLKIKGESAVGVKVAYDALAEGATPAENPKFTLVVTNKVPTATIDLPGAAVDVKGKPESGADSAQIGTVNVENATSATVSGDAKVDNIETGDGFTGDVEFNDNIELTVTTTEDLLKAFSNEGVTAINVAADLDLKEIPVNQLVVVGVKSMNVPEGKTITLGNSNYISLNNDFTLTGKGTITNEFENANPAQRTAKILFQAFKGNFKASDITLINDRTHHWHGPTSNSSAVIYFTKANLNFTKVNIKSGEFTVCGMDRPTSKSVTSFTDCSFWSSSSSANNGQHWAYTVRICGSKSTFKNCTVDGIQGGISPEWGVEMTIDGGTYSTREKLADGSYGNPFDAVYVTAGAKLTILGGDFYGARPSTTAEGNSCIRTGDNDVQFPDGYIYLKGGKFSGKAFNHGTNKLIPLPNGYEYVKNTGADADKYPWIVKAAQ